MISIRWPDLWPMSSMVRLPARLFGRCDGLNHSGKLGTDYGRIRHSGMVRRTRPGISRFSGAQLRTIVRCFASPRNDGVSSPDPRRHILLDAGLAFRRNGALV